MKAIILARVSTKEQEDGHSIAAQKQRLIDYCARKGLEILRTFEIVESSTRGERKDFNALLEFAKAQKERTAIVADAVDRIQRSFKESVLLDELIRRDLIELHFNREGMVIGKEASASDVMRWDFSVMGAKSYVLQLSENVKRSMEFKRKNGEWSGPAPVGYLNIADPVTRKNTLTLDPARALHIRRLFEEYGSGLYSIQEMAKRAKEWGLRNNRKSAVPLSGSQVHMLLQNPFYYGEMCIKGQLFPHRYDPIISRNLFERCQDIRLGRGRINATKQTKQDFVFRSLLTCAVSGRKVTCDLKKGQYVYLICRDPENPDKKLFVSEADVLKQIEQVFKKLVIPEPLLEALTRHLKDSHEAEKGFHQLAIEQLQKEDTLLQKKQERLLDLFLEQSITKPDYDKKQHDFHQRRHEINRELSAHIHADDSFRITVSSLFSLASRAYQLFRSSKNEQKRQLINFMFSNLQLRGKTLEYSMRSPFHLMVKPHSYQEWLGD